MKLLITGGSGFVGAELARQLLKKDSLSLRGQAAQRISKIVLVDRVAAPADLAADPRISSEIGDFLDQLHPQQNQNAPPLIAAHADLAAVFHLAAAVSGECEADFDLGMRSNYASTHALLEACRRLNTQPLVFFASSIAVFGHTEALPMPDVLTDTSLPNPQTSYGIQKYIGEQLMADYARKGYIAARSARLATVTVRAGKPNGAASGFFSGMIREPLAGLRSNVPVPAQTRHPLTSVEATVAGIIRCAESSDSDWGSRTAINMPALSCTVSEMADALKTVAGQLAYDLLDWKIDPNVAKIVAAWPRALHSPRANALGLKAHESFEEIVRLYKSKYHP